MNLEQLHYAKYVMEYHSITMAAQQLFITQSAISQSIHTLEKELGIKLFERSRQGTFPTEEGRWILPKLMEVYQSLQDIKYEIKKSKEDMAGTIKLATIPSVFMTFLPEKLARFKEEYPLVNYQILEFENYKVIEAIQNQEAEIGFIALTHDTDHLNPNLVFQQLTIRSEYYLVVAANSPFANRSEISLDEVINEHFILYGERFFTELLSNFLPNWSVQSILFQSINPEVIKKSVMLGLGVSILSNLMIENDPHFIEGRLVRVKLKGYPFHTPLSYSLIYRKDSKHSPLIKKLASFFY